jgi:hypothetical protein
MLDVTMVEVWLRSNRRVLVVGLIPGLAMCAAATTLFLISTEPWVRGLAAAAAALGLLLMAIVARQLLRPRLGYADGRVLFYLRAGEPIAVPVPVVEAFFLGQGPAYLPGTPDDSQETVNLVARLSQKHPEWMKLDVKPALGRWCEGYVSIRGTWCEPLNNEVIRRLNRRLTEVSREARDRADA